MTVYIMPFPTNPVLPQFEENVILDGTAYKFDFNYNSREKLWYFSVRTSDGIPIAEGIKIVLNFPLLRKIANDIRPPGEIFAIENDSFGENIGQPPGLTDIGNRVDLVYLDRSELI